jgi:hypothetical protein
MAFEITQLFKIKRLTIEPKATRLETIQKLIEKELNKEFGESWTVQHAALARVLTAAIDAATTDIHDQLQILDDRLNAIESRPAPTPTPATPPKK